MSLVAFRLSNYLCFRDEVVFEMNAQLRSSLMEDHSFKLVDDREELLKVALVYGPNASGKTTLLDGLFALRAAVLWSHYDVEKEKSFSILPHISELDTGRPTELEVEFVKDDQLFRYGFAFCDGDFTEEWLIGYPKSKPVTYYRLSDGGVTQKTFSDYLPGKKLSLLQDMRKDKLLLSSAAANGHEFLSEIYQYIRSIFSFRQMETSATYDYESSLAEQMQKDPELYKFVLDLLRQADVGVVNVRVVEERFELFDADSSIQGMFNDEFIEKLKERAPSKKYKLLFEHKLREGSYYLPWVAQSDGTIYLLTIASWLYEGLADGAVCVLDELGGSLHEDIAASIVRLFQSPVVNKNNSQLIASTHCSALMEGGIGHDQIWFVTKNEFGESDLNNLVDFKPRSSDNIRKKYKLGHYGAIPLQQSFEF